MLSPVNRDVLYNSSHKVEVSPRKQRNDGKFLYESFFQHIFYISESMIAFCGLEVQESFPNRARLQAQKAQVWRFLRHAESIISYFDNHKVNIANVTSDLGRPKDCVNSNNCLPSVMLAGSCINDKINDSLNCRNVVFG